MRPRFALSLVAIIGTITLGAALAQESPAPPAQPDPFLRVLGGGAAQAAPAGVATAAATAPCDPAAPPVGIFEIGDGAVQVQEGWIDDPAAAPAPLGAFAIAGTDDFVELAAPEDVYQYLLAADGSGNWIQRADPAVLASLFSLGGAGYGQADGHVHLRATLREGELSLTRDGQPLAAELVERDGSTVRVRDEEGRLLATFEISEDGRVTIPAGWSFSGPPQWMSERPSRRVIGIRTGAVEPALARHLGLGDGEGVLVTEVIEGHPAAEAGLEPLDVIVAIDGARPATLESLKDALAEKSEGDTISLTVARAGHTMEIRCGVSSVSAPIGVSELPEGAYALGLAGPGGAPSGLVIGEGEGGTASAPIVARSVPLLMRRGAASAPGAGGVASFQLGGSASGIGGAAPGGDASTRFRIATTEPGGIITLNEAPSAPSGDGAGRLGAIEERLDRLEKLLEQLVEQRARSPEPRERR